MSQNFSPNILIRSITRMSRYSFKSVSNMVFERFSDFGVSYLCEIQG